MQDKSCLLLATLACLLLLGRPQARLVQAQGVKGGSGSQFSSFNQQLVPSTLGASNNQFSSSFVEMFNQLTPAQQQQFVRQMSSSNRRIFQQAIQPQTNFAFSEELTSNSAGQLPAQGSFSSTGSTLGGLGLGFGATKSGTFRQQQSSLLSPVQQNALFRSQQSKSITNLIQPTLAPTSQFSFSRQISQSNQQQPTVIQLPQTNEANFQSSRTIVNTVQQPTQQSYFNRVQSVQQVAQPVVLPTSEQSFRRVQKFSSQPLPVDSSSSSFSQQQFVQQQQQPQPIQQLSSSFNRFQQQQQPVGFSQFTSSAASNLAGNAPNGFLSGADAGFTSAALQQEKVDQNGVSIVDGTSNNLFQQQQLANQLVLPGQLGSSSFEQSSGFDSADAQQKSAQVPDDFYGLTAASINNKWYIMKPVDNLQQVPLSRALLSNLASSTGATGAGASSSSASTPTPKKRAAESAPSSSSTPSTAGVNKKKKEEDSKPPVSTSSSLMETDAESGADEDEQKRR